MIRKTLFFVVIITLFSCKNETSKEEVQKNVKIEPEWSAFHLNGNVKSIEDYTTEVETTSSNPRQFENQYQSDIALQFDEKGKLTGKTIYREDGSVAKVFVYDGKEKLLSEKQYTNLTGFVETKYTWENENNTITTKRTNDGTLIDKEVYHYVNGLKIDKFKYNQQEIQIDRISYKYDADNRLTDEIYYKGQATMQSRVFKDYDPNGNLAAEAMYNKNDELQWKMSMKYENNLLVQSVTKDANQKLLSDVVKKYDDKNRMIFKSLFDSFDNSFNAEKFEYDAFNNTTSWEIYKNDVLKNKTIFRYDDKNNLISEIQYDANNKILSEKEYQYTYDSKSNWITKKTIINKTKTFITSRKIAYY